VSETWCYYVVVFYQDRLVKSRIIIAHPIPDYDDCTCDSAQPEYFLTALYPLSKLSYFVMNTSN
jgi:hypothetical protein